MNCNRSHARYIIILPYTTVYFEYHALGAIIYMKTTEILTSINAFMGQMRDGNTRELIANLQAALDYQTEKLRIYEEKYKAETGKERPELTDDERRRLAKRGRAMNQYLLSITENTWSPSTVMGWYSKLIADKYDSTGPDQKSRGRKPITDDLKALILRLAEQNPSWGYKRIRDYAVYLGYEVSFMTVKRIMNKYGYFPPTDGRTNSDWEMFFNAHQNVITACDFATYELVTPHGLQREHILFFENVFTREVWLGGIVHDPNGNWMAQIARNQCDMWDGKLLGQKYLIHDRDPLFCSRFKNIVHSIGCKTKAIPPRSPECNGYMESFIKTFKKECLNHFVLTSEAQLRYVVKEFLEYYNHERPHSALDGRMIKPWPQDADGEIVEFSRLGGLLKSYRRVKMAA